MTIRPIQVIYPNFLNLVRFGRIIPGMALTSATAPTTRRRASREADARVGERAHMLIWRAGKTQGAIAEAIGIESTALGKKLRGKNG